MGKPENRVYEAFTEKYKKINQKLGKNQFLVPYLMSSHPGSTMKEAVELAEYLMRSRLYAGAGTGLLPDTFDDFNLHVLYGGGSENNGKYMCR